MLNKTSIHYLINYALQKLLSSGVTDSPKIDAEILMAKAIKKNRSYLYTWPEKQLSTNEINEFRFLLSSRLIGKPIAYILGKKEFWGLEFKVNESTLIPRPDTEIVVDKAIELAKKIQQNNTLDKVKVLDLGTGSGAIICSIKHELKNIDAFAIEVDKVAIKIAKINAQNLSLDINFIKSNWFNELKPSSHLFNLIVANPPYIEEQDQHLKQGDLKFEPISALASGKDGLRDITHICQQASKFLVNNGWLLIEHGYNQAHKVKELMQQNDFGKIETIKDHGGNDRATLGNLTYAKNKTK